MSRTLGRNLLAIALMAGMAIAIYSAVGASLGGKDFVRALSSVSAAQLAALLGLSLVNYALRLLRWSWYLRRLGHRIPFGRDCLYYLAGFALTVSPAKAGEAVRGVYLKKHGVPYSDTFAALVAERLLDVLAVAVLGALILPLFGQYWWLVGVAAAIVLAVTIIVTRQATPRVLESAAARFGTRIGGLLVHVARLLRSSAALLRPGLLLPGLAIGLASWAAEGFGLYLLLGWLGLPVSIEAGMGVYALSMLAGALSFLPGGLGGAEAALAILVVALGGSSAVAFAAAVICRAATLWFAVVIGLLALIVLETRPLRAVG